MTENLISSVGIDYTYLRDLLAAGEWRLADKETARVMLAVSGREKECWLTAENIDNFPCEDLRTIDQLWVKYSNGRFGFSVQKRIYLSLGGTRDYDYGIWQAFGGHVGWKKEEEWLSYKDITFDLAAPQAHLPFSTGLLSRTLSVGFLWVSLDGGFGEGFWERGIAVLLSRRDL
ncbi:MAG: GUN4 domain-containing protein [Scytonematopsis contorta HA4267-MV1]|nr:GUN4 domain-containing protein [Scytonematopsis contorta HA4267-MV1]